VLNESLAPARPALAASVQQHSPALRRQGSVDFSKIGSPELDKLLSEANTELDPQKRVDLTYQADQMIWEEGHSVTLYQRPDLVACKKTFVNFGALGYADIDYSIIGFKS
jgi:peptide/nickel transport system substrate-binding protein